MEHRRDTRVDMAGEWLLHGQRDVRIQRWPGWWAPATDSSTSSMQLCSYVAYKFGDHVGYSVIIDSELIFNLCRFLGGRAVGRTKP